MATFVVVYGGFVDINTRRLNEDAAGRCDKAIAIAEEYPNSFIVFGGGPFIPKMPELAEDTVHYLEDCGWPSERILWNPKGTSTVDESEADLETLVSRQDVSKVFVVTSWNHLPRVWLIWKLLGGCKAKFRASCGTMNISYVLWSLLWECGGYAVLLKRIRKLKSHRAFATS